MIVPKNKTHSRSATSASKSLDAADGRVRLPKLLDNDNDKDHHFDFLYYRQDRAVGGGQKEDMTTRCGTLNAIVGGGQQEDGTALGKCGNNDCDKTNIDDYDNSYNVDK